MGVTLSLRARDAAFLSVESVPGLEQFVQKKLRPVSGVMSLETKS